MRQPTKTAKTTFRVMIREISKFRRETQPAACGGLLLMWVEKHEAVYVRKEKP